MTWISIDFDICEKGNKVNLAVLEKVFGIILLAIAIKLFTSNAKMLF